MNLYLCGKQLQAEDVANALGNFSRANGFYRLGSDTIVTWAKGHLLEMCKPEDYNPRFKRWDITDLPIKPYEWKKRVRQAVPRGDLAQHQQPGKAAIGEHVKHRARRIEGLARIVVRKHLDPDPDEQ